MPRTGGEITKAKILETAERLFSEKGFDATSIDSISKSVGINKATIYYHFKDKNDILISLYEGIMADLNHHLNKEQVARKSLQEKIKEEIKYLQSKRKLLSILMMEALKDKNTNHALFLCAKSVIQSEMEERLSEKGFDNPHHEQLYNLHEFFTGFIPLIAFIIFQDKWIKLFNGSKKNSVDDFIEIFTKTHLATHLA
jgi:AcrR family transcriptional regulator